VTVSSTQSRRIAVEPKSGRFESLEQAVELGGGEVVDIEHADALVWADPTVPDRLPSVLAQGNQVEWVALPFAGIEPYVPFLDHDRVWTCARGVYSRPVAEHVMATGLAGLRGLVGYARANQWSDQIGHNLLDGRVAIFGAGGITTELIRLLGPFNVEINVVRRTPDPVPGAAKTVALQDRLQALAGADLVVLALALTPETHQVISTPELHAMASHGWLVNVARGRHVDDKALIEALQDGVIGGACLDVTDPEPLPDDHAYWTLPNVLITPHVGNTPEMGVPLLADHIVDNVSRFCYDKPLMGVVDVDAGY